MKNLCRSILFCFLIFSIKGFSQTPFSENGKFGFKLNDEVIIQPKFDYATDFNEGLACVKQNNKWGFIDIKGNWIIDPKYLSAQPMRNGKAKVKSENGIGLIDSIGNIIVPTQFTYIEEWNNEYQVKSGAKKGLLKEGWQLIPPKYSNINILGNELAYAKKENDLYDVYTPNGLFLEDQAKNFYNTISNYNCILKKDGKYGVFNSKTHQWIEEPKYEYIHLIPVDGYYFDETVNKSMGYNILALFTKVDDEITELTDENYYANGLITLKTLDCKQTLSENITGFRRTDNELVDFGVNSDYILYRDNKKGKLGANLSVTQPIYNDIFSFGDGEIRQLESKFLYYNEENQIEIEADSIIPLKYMVEEYYDDWGEFINFSNQTLPGALIVKKDNYSTVYNTNLHRFIDKKLPYETIYEVYITERIENEPTTFAIQYELEDKKGYFLLNDDVCSELNYTDLFYLPQEEKTFAKDLVANKEVLLNYKKPSQIIASADDIVHTDSWNILFEYYDEWGEFLLDEKQLFTLPFYILKNDNKMGVLCLNNKVVTPKYDTLYPYQSDSTYIITELDGKFGAINLMNGKTVEPAYNEIPVIVEDEYSDKFYSFFESKEGLKYYGTNGNWYISNNNYFEINQDESGKWNVIMYSTNADTLLPLFDPTYDYIQESESIDFLVAQKEGKFGIINPFGEVIVPFEYTKIYYGEHEIYFDGMYRHSFTLFNKNKRGLYIDKKGIIIPSEYEEIYPVPNHMTGDVAYWIVKNKKYYGLLDSVGDTILPPIYSNIEDSEEFLSSNFLYLRDKKKNLGAFYNNEVIIEPQYNSFEIIRTEGIFEPFIVEIYHNKKNGIYFHSTGKTIPPNFDFIDIGLSTDLATICKSFIVNSSNGVGVYNVYAEEILPPIFDDVYFISENKEEPFPVLKAIKEDKFYARVYDKANEKWLHQFEASILFDEINDFDAIVFASDRIIKYDLKTGEAVNTIDNDNFKIQLNSGTLIKENGKFGYTTYDQNVIIEPVFSNIQYLFKNEGVFFGSIDGENYYLEPWSGNLIKQAEYEKL